MAKQSAPKIGTTKVRFVMLEAEGPEGDLSQIFSAIQNAVKPGTTIIQQRVALANGGGAAALLDQASLDSAGDEDTKIELEEEEDAQQPAAYPPRPSKPRKPTVPKVVDVDLTSDVSLEVFATQHPVTTDLGSGLIGHSQKMTVAARAMAEKKTVGHRS